MQGKREFRVVSLDGEREALLYAVDAEAFDEYVVAMSAEHEVESGRVKHVRVYDPDFDVVFGLWLTGDGEVVEYDDLEGSPA